MEIKKAIEVTGMLLAERPDGTCTLAISTKSSTFEFEFSAELWQNLAESARWFRTHVHGTPLVVVEQVEEETKP